MEVGARLAGTLEAGLTGEEVAALVSGLAAEAGVPPSAVRVALVPGSLHVVALIDVIEAEGGGGPPAS